MRRDELAEAVQHELETMKSVVRELTVLLEDTEGRAPTVREKTAAGAFLAQFYAAIENTLACIARFHGVPLPHDEARLPDLFERFCEPAAAPLPALFDKALARKIAPYRQFRNIMYHGHAFELEWDRMEEGIKKVGPLLVRFGARVQNHLRRLR